MSKLMSETQALELYDQMINDVSGEVKIGSLTYDAAYVLKNVDETAYRCGFNDFCDAENIEIE